MRYETNRALREAANEIAGTVSKLIMIVVVGCFFGFGATLGFFFTLPFVTRLL